MYLSTELQATIGRCISDKNYTYPDFSETSINISRERELLLQVNDALIFFHKCVTDFHYKYSFIIHQLKNINIHLLVVQK